MMLSDKTILVTGASSGIGAAAAHRFAAEGARLVLGARRADRLEAVAEAIRGDGGEAVTLAGDVDREDYAAALVARAEDAFGGLDAAFNNAGTLGALGPVPEMQAGDWASVVQTNLTSAFYAAKHQIPALRARGGGAIVFTGTFVGHTVGLPGMAAYAASKAGLIGLVEVLAIEHGPENIRVNALLPGGTKTDMAPADEGSRRVVAGFHALKRMAEPEEIAGAALFLVSDLGSFVTGSAMLADGGNSIAKA
jgi:NAD(P)-dependent dehydrogenase (short-subunit alcohol dehydrogenase family)